ncbi:hypothetical protein E4U30_004967, partial [Claviceps sp. LM220 group G6]
MSRRTGLQTRPLRNKYESLSFATNAGFLAHFPELGLREMGYRLDLSRGKSTGVLATNMLLPGIPFFTARLSTNRAKNTKNTFRLHILRGYSRRTPPPSSALSESDYGLLTTFAKAIEVEYPFQECLRCSRRSISRLKLNGAGICQTRRADEGSEVPRFSSENNLDSGGVLTHLEQLTDIEEILIARVQTAVNVFQVRGVQFQYRVHAAHF